MILHEFTQNTKSEGQIAMIVISSVLMFGTFLFLVTIVYAQRSRAWRISVRLLIRLIRVTKTDAKTPHKIFINIRLFY